MDAACLPVPQQKSMLHVNFFPFSGRVSQKYRWRRVKMWMHPGLQPVTTTHRDQSIFRLQRTTGIARQCLRLIPWAS
jgi:hypothetical protein